MSRLTTEHWPSLSRTRGDSWGSRSSIAERDGLRKSEAIWLAAGLVAIGVGILAWSYLGPDLKRYLKIQSM
jgi:hypothetical protein